jgi:hypothetical protein
MKNHKIKILQVVTVTSQTLDYTLPFFYYLREDNNYEVVILYCCLNRKKLTKGSVYLKDVDSFLNIKSVDLSDFTNFSSSFFIRVIRKMFGSSLGNSLSIKNYLGNLKMFGAEGVAYLLTAFKKNLEDFIVGKILKPDKLMNQINPDVIFFDNRLKFKNLASEMIGSYIAKSNYKVKIIPHAPHGNSSDDEFIPILENFYPKNVEHWSSLISAIPAWKKDSEKLSEFKHIGLTALDNDWYNYVFDKRKLLKKNECLNILYIPQKIQEKGDFSQNQFDLIGYEEELRNIINIISDIDSQCKSFDFVIKPHPKISINTVRSLIHDLAHSSISYSTEPLFFHMEHADLIISEFSTAALYGACFIPILIVDSKLEKNIRSGWTILDNLYGGIELRYSLKNLKNTIDIIQRGSEKNMVNNNRKHLELYFGNCSIQNIQKSIDAIQ